MIDPQNPYQYNLNQILNRKSKTEINLFFQVIELLLYEKAHSSSLLDVYKTLQLEDFCKLVTVLDGQQVKLPSKKELEENLLTALLYYDREILGLDWSEIRTKYPEFQISSIKYALKLKSLNSYVKQKMQEILRRYEKQGDE